MDVSQFTIGDTTILGITELVLSEPHAVFPTAPGPDLAALVAGLTPDLYRDGQFVSVIRSWIVRAPGLLAVIDTGAGNHKPRPASPRFDRLDTGFRERLVRAGVDPAEVNLVVCTHLHVDHVGWNTTWVDGRWQPTFPRARHVLPRIEVERWLNDPADTPARQPFQDSVAPLLDRAGTWLATGEETLAPGLHLMPLPGHSPGMMGVALDRGDQAALFIADALHSPVQVLRPAWSSRYCADPAAAAVTRTAMLDQAARVGTLLLAAHVGGSGGMRITRTPSGFGVALEPSRA